MWEEVPRWKRLAFASVLLVLVVAPVVIALVVAMVDPTVVAGSIVVANLIEIVSGSAVAYLLSCQGMVILQRVMEKNLAIPLLSDLHAVLSDRLGIPRAEEASLSANNVFAVAPLDQ